MVLEFLNTPEFQDWQWQLSDNMRTALEKIYANNQPQLEIEAVKALVGAGQTHPPFRSPSVPMVAIEVESSFLHGPRSQVRFKIGGKSQQCELADLVVLGSYVENQRLQWQRVCFIQAKRSHGGSATSAFRYQVKPDQLALLRAFPPFTGVSGVFKGQRHHLRNHTGMLGAYGFLARPGEFSIISARVLDYILGGKSSFPGKELISAFLLYNGNIQYIPSFCPFCFPFYPEYCPEYRKIIKSLFNFPWHFYCQHHCHIQWCSILFCMGIDVFVQHWTSLRLGEIWCSKDKVKSDQPLASCICNLVSYVNKDTKRLPNLLRLLKDAMGDLSSKGDNPESPYFENEGGGIGVLSAIMKVERA